MINYIQQLLPRIRQYNSHLDIKELFVDKLFTLLQPNNAVHQYTFTRDNRLFLAVNGKTTEGSWELLNTGQLLIKRSRNDIITLDFDFLHPDVMIMKLGGTSKDPFIIYRKDVIKDSNVYKFLKYFEAEKTGEKIYELPNKLLSSSELNSLICDENGLPYTGNIFSNPYDFYFYSPQKVRDIKIIRDGILVKTLYEVKYAQDGILLVFWQKSLSTIEIGDRLVAVEKGGNTANFPNDYYINLHSITVKLDQNRTVVSIKKETTLAIIALICFLLIITTMSIVIYSNNSKSDDQNSIEADSVISGDSAAVIVEPDTTGIVGVDTLQ